MIIYQSVFSWISTILSILCGVWLVGLGVFVFIRWLINKIKMKKGIKKDEQKRKEASK